MTKVLFTLGGADANENAIKLARGYTGRYKILARYRSYHGASAGAMAATGDPRRVAWEPMLMPGVVHFLDPYRYRSTFHRTNPNISEEEFTRDYLNHLEEIIQYEGPETIAAILIESVTGTNGIIIPPEGYMQGVRALCDKYGIVMIADEVMSGFGRTGKWFAVDHWNVVPDIMTMAKGLTSAYAPLGAVAMKPQIAAHFDEVAYKSGLTYTSHPISLAAAIANINVMKEDHIVEHAAAMGPVLKRMLTRFGRVASIGRRCPLDWIVRNYRVGQRSQNERTDGAVEWIKPGDDRLQKILLRSRLVSGYSLAHGVDHPAADYHGGAIEGRL